MTVAPSFSSPASAAPLRVVQWATGNIGAYALRQVIAHPRLALQGVFAYGKDKIGRDAGDLCGLPATGVKATGDIADIVALKPDCVLYMPLATNLDEICTLLQAGVNVVTTRTDFHNPRLLAPQSRARIEAACERGGASLHSAGVSPGFITETMPLALATLQRRLDLLHIDEFANLSRRDSPDMLFGVMGFGEPPGPFDQGRLAYIQAAFAPSLQLVAEALSIPIERVEAHGELALAREDVAIAAGRIKAGSVAAQRVSVTLHAKTGAALAFRANWFCTDRIDADWPLLDTGWRIQIDGDAPLSIDMKFAVPLERMAEASPAFTANRAINAIASVCAAAPGIRTALDLPYPISPLIGPP